MKLTSDRMDERPAHSRQYKGWNLSCPAAPRMWLVTGDFYFYGPRARNWKKQTGGTLIGLIEQLPISWVLNFWGPALLRPAGPGLWWRACLAEQYRWLFFRFGQNSRWVGDVYYLWRGLADMIAAIIVGRRLNQQLTPKKKKDWPNSVSVVMSDWQLQR